uniref:phosphopantetheine-binding protein n=1 Tax=Staphylococcus aureus TaxID=1280 RepID=UPI00210BA699
SEKGDWNPFGQEEISRQINNVSDFFFSMTKILADILHVNQVGIHDNFFELGGHSLKATLVVNRIEASTGKRLQLGDLLQKPTVFELAQAIAKVKEQNYEVIPEAIVKDDYVLRSAPTRMYFLWKSHPKDT